MYEIILHTWYPESPREHQREVYPKGFDSIEDAAKYLGENIDRIVDEYSLEWIEIRFKQAIKP